MKKNLTFLKNSLLGLLFVSLFSFSASAQQWDTVGAAGFSDGIVNHQTLDVYNDTTYVAYKDVFNQNELRVQMYDGNTWVDVGGPNISSGPVGSLDLLVAGSDNIYVAYVNGTNGIDVMHYNGVTWSIVGNSIVSSVLNGNLATPSLAYTAIKGIHIAYVENDLVLFAPDIEMTIKAQKFDGTNWVYLSPNSLPGAIVGPTSPPSGNFGSPDLNFRGNGLYMAIELDGIQVLWHGAAGWGTGYDGSTNGFASTAPFSTSPDLEFAPNNDHYVAFSDDANGGKTTVARHNGSTWVTMGTAGFSTFRASSIDLDFDNNGKPYVTQIEAGNSGPIISVFTYDGTNWGDLGTGNTTVYAGASLASSNLKVDNNTVYLSFANENQKSTVMEYDITTNINQIPTLNKEINIYPNPTKAQLTIEGVEGIESIRILTMDGKVMETITTTNNTISVEGLPQGVYTVEVITTEGVGYKNFVKQ